MILTLISIFTLIGLLSYYIIFSQIKIPSFDIDKSNFNEPVSVIICAKNELENIKTFFPFWIHQNYSNFELIIVNDQSSDGSFEYLNQLETDYPNLKIIHIQKDAEKQLKGKRHALQKGIETAKNHYLLFTDADCKPFSKHWISEMTSAFYHSKTEIVIGYSPYRKEKGFLNKLIQFETMLTALQYFGFAQAGMPYMSVGRNVAYKKSLFSENIFQESNKSISGDDDLVFQQLATNKNTAYQITQNSITESIPVHSFKEWFQQKKRHLGAGQYYKTKFKILLGLFVLLNMFFYMLLFTFLLKHFVFYTFMIICVKTLIYKVLICKIPLFKLKNSISIIQFVTLDIIYWFIYIIFALILKF